MTIASYVNNWFGTQLAAQPVLSGAELIITDGEVSINLADTSGGFFLLGQRNSWAMGSSKFKKGGVFSNSQLVDGRALKHRVFDNVVETLEVGLIFNSPDDMQDQLNTIENLLKVRAAEYWLKRQGANPVYVQVTLGGGSETRYALLSAGDIIVPGDIFNEPCNLEQGRMWPIRLILVRQPFWLRAIPGQTQGLISFSSQQAWDYNLAWAVESSLPGGQVFAFAKLSDGTIYAGGASEILVFSGGSWAVSSTAPVTVSANVTAALLLANGDILFGESGRIIKRNAAGTWSVETSEPTGQVWALLEATSGEVYAGDTGRILKRDINGTWAEDDNLPGGQVYSLLQTASGRLFAGEVGQILRTADVNVPVDLTVAVITGTDDAEQDGSTVVTTSSDLDIFQPNIVDQIGVRFQNVTIPNGATINSAVIRFTAQDNDAGTTGSLNIYCEDEDDAATFAASSNNISSRTKTTASAVWSNAEAWTTNNEHDTPDFAAAVQEVVNRAGWASGNALAAIFDDIGASSNDRDAFSYDGSPGKAPTLVVTYTVALPSGDTWEVNTTLPSGDVRALLLVGSTVIAADNSQFLSSVDDGETWGVLDTSPSGQVLSLFDAGSQVLYAGENGVIWKSPDAGVSWEIDDNSIPAGDIDDFVQDGDDLRAADDGQILLLDNTLSVTIGQEETNDNIIFLANHHKTANLTHVKIDDGGSFTDIFPIATFPQVLFPVTPAVNDALYFGINTSVNDSGPFFSLIFNLSTPASSTTSYTITWEYYNGSWVTLTAQDGTAQLSQIGVNGIYWEQPSDLTSVAVNGITGDWLRARLSALTGTLTPPEQDTRDIYTVSMPFAQVSAAQIEGAIDALLKLQLNNRSAAGGPGGSSPLLYQNHFWLGSKPVVGHENFRAFLNFADEQNVSGVTVDVSVDIDSATSIEADSALSSAVGRRTFFDAGIAAAGAGLDNMVDRVSIDLSTTVATNYYGSYRAFIRCRQSGGSAGEVTMRLKVLFGSGGISALGDTQATQTTDDHHLIEFTQPITLPISTQFADDEVADQIQIVVQISTAASDADLFLYDLFLLPTDTMFVDSRDLANNANSTVENAKRMLMDSITVPKLTIRTLVQDTTSGVFLSSWRADSRQEISLPTEEQMRIWLLSARTISTSDATLISHPEAVVSLKSWKVERELI